MKKHILISVFCICAALALTACGISQSNSESQTSSVSEEISSSQPVSSSEDISSETISSQPVSAELSQQAKDELAEVMNSFLGFGPGSAGSSVASFGGAGRLLNWCAANSDADSAEVEKAVSEWYAAQADNSKENLTESWPMVKGAAYDLIKGDEYALGTLTDADVTLDPSPADSASFEKFAPVMDKIFLNN